LKTLWTLYSGFAYILYSIILALVLGWNNWSIVEYTAIAGGPVLWVSPFPNPQSNGIDMIFRIYLGRLALATYYNYRTSSLQKHLDELQTQRDGTIDKLKAATKYNSTQQLLEKYGGGPSPRSSPSQRTASGSKAKPTQPGPATAIAGRTGYAPPPTANIPGRNAPVVAPSTPQRTPLDITPALARTMNAPGSSSLTSAIPPMSSPAASAEFAPNAFSAPPQYSAVPDQPRWYDRLMDVLLGEDETLPKNRMALICKYCRLVNGQAPPGIKRPEDLGKWRCSGCGGWNGEDNEAEKLVAEMTQRARVRSESSAKDEPRERMRMGSRESGTDDDAVMVPTDEAESDITQYSDLSKNGEETEEPEKATQEPPPKPKRGRPKGSGKKKA